MYGQKNWADATRPADIQRLMEPRKLEVLCRFLVTEGVVQIEWAKLLIISVRLRAG